MTVDIVLIIIACISIGFGFHERYKRVENRVYCRHERNAPPDWVQKEVFPTVEEQRQRMAKIAALRSSGVSVIDAIEKVGR